MKNRKILYLCVSMLMILIFPTTSLAAYYGFTGYKFSGPGFTYKRDDSMNWIETTKAAANSWTNDYLSGVTVSESSTGKVIIEKGNYWWRDWSGNFSKTSSYGVPPSGITYTGLISINTEYTSLTSYTWATKQSLIAHEMGHALGLTDQYSTDVKLLMYPKDIYRRDHNIIIPQYWDAVGVHNIYY